MLVIETLIIIISVFVLWTQIYIQDWKSAILFLFVLSLCHYVLKTPVYAAFGIAGIISCLLNLSYSKIESYSNKGDKEEVAEEVAEESESESNDDSNDDEIGSFSEHKNMGY